MRVEPTELPPDWSTRTIGECCEILDSRRVPINEDERFFRKGAIPYYGANGQQGWIDDFLFDEDLVLIAEDGGLFDEYSTRPIAYRISGKSWVNNHAHILRAKGETTNAWVFHNLVHEDIRHYISGGTRAKLTQNELRQVEVPFPEKPEQTRIAVVLDTVPNGVFAPYTSIPTNLLFFNRSGPTREVWYYEQPLPEGQKNYTKTAPIQFEEFADLIAWWGKAGQASGREENERAWKISAKELLANGCNLDCKNPRAKEDITHLPPEQLAADILKKEQHIAEIMGNIRNLLAKHGK